MNKPTFYVKQEESKRDYARFLIEPLEQGYGHTLGVGLRRVLLTSLPGAAITSVRISGLKHQFDTLKGVKEDGVDLVLNLKKVRLSYQGERPVRLTLSAKGTKGKGEVKAGDIKAPANVKIVNPEHVLANLSDSKSKLDIEMEAETGVGYSPAEDRKTGNVGVIPVDADFSPVKRVNIKVEETRVGRLTNYDKLTLELWTDGTIDPQETLKKAAEILIAHFGQIVSPQIPPVRPRAFEASSPTASLSVEELGLPTRIANALVNGGYETVADLAAAGEAELSKVRNLGGKSLKIIKAALKEKGMQDL